MPGVCPTAAPTLPYCPPSINLHLHGLHMFNWSCNKTPVDTKFHQPAVSGQHASCTSGQRRRNRRRRQHAKRTRVAAPFDLHSA